MPEVEQVNNKINYNQIRALADSKSLRLRFSDNKTFKSSKFLPLPLNLNSRKIIKINKENFFILSNNDYIHVLSKNK